MKDSTPIKSTKKLKEKAVTVTPPPTPPVIVISKKKSRKKREKRDDDDDDDDNDDDDNDDSSNAKPKKKKVLKLLLQENEIKTSCKSQSCKGPNGENKCNPNYYFSLSTNGCASLRCYDISCHPLYN